MLLALLLLIAQTPNTADADNDKDTTSEATCPDDGGWLQSSLLAQHHLAMTWGVQKPRIIGVASELHHAPVVSVIHGGRLVQVQPASEKNMDLGSGCGHEVPGDAYALPSAGPADGNAIFFGTVPDGFKAEWFPARATAAGKDNSGAMPLGEIKLTVGQTCSKKSRAGDEASERMVFTAKNNKAYVIHEAAWDCVTDSYTPRAIYLGTLDLSASGTHETWALFNMYTYEDFSIQALQLGRDGEIAHDCDSILFGGGC